MDAHNKKLQMNNILMENVDKTSKSVFGCI